MLYVYEARRLVRHLPIFDGTMSVVVGDVATKVPGAALAAPIVVYSFAITYELHEVQHTPTCYVHHRNCPVIVMYVLGRCCPDMTSYTFLYSPNPSSLALRAQLAHRRYVCPLPNTSLDSQD